MIQERCNRAKLFNNSKGLPDKAPGAEAITGVVK